MFRDWKMLFCVINLLVGFNWSSVLFAVFVSFLRCGGRGGGGGSELGLSEGIVIYCFLVFYNFE